MRRHYSAGGPDGGGSGAGGGGGGSSSGVLVFVCGPDPMVDAASEASMKHGFTFHSETFAL